MTSRIIHIYSPMTKVGCYKMKKRNPAFDVSAISEVDITY